jgi:polyhydroxyalkanoate synthesis regulator phasin
VSRIPQFSVLEVFQFHRFGHFHHAGTAEAFGNHVVTSGTEHLHQNPGGGAPGRCFPLTERSMCTTHRIPRKTDESTESISGDTTDSGRLLTDGGTSPEVSEEFLERLEDVEQVRQQIKDLQNELERLDIGLEDEDTERLLWARLSGWSLTDVRNAFEAIEDLQRADTEDLVVRLVAQLGGMTQQEADEFLAECHRLQRKYDHLSTEEGSA